MFRAIATSSSRPIEWVRSSAGILNQVIQWVNRYNSRRAVTGTYTVQDGDYYLGATVSCTITLAGGVEGRRLIIKDETGTAVITITGNIDGASKTINTAYGVLNIIYTGTAWVTI